MEALKTVCTFHKADWAGILIVDKSLEMWSPAVWYDPELGEMAPTLFNEIEYFEYFPRWVDALKTGEPVVFSDVSAAEDMTTDETAQYERLATHGVIGAPFTEYLTGFLVVRNPQRYPCIPDLVQMLAFVTLSTYYLQELQEGMQMMHRAKENRSQSSPSRSAVLQAIISIIIHQFKQHSKMDSFWRVHFYVRAMTNRNLLQSSD